jgi:hypothetical protein
LENSCIFGDIQIFALIARTATASVTMDTDDVVSKNMKG